MACALPDRFFSNSKRAVLLNESSACFRFTLGVEELPFIPLEREIDDLIASCNN